MSKPTWWTCGCGKKNRTVPGAALVCSACSKTAAFKRSAPVGQGKLFGGKGCR